MNTKKFRVFKAEFRAAAARARLEKAAALAADARAQARWALEASKVEEALDEKWRRVYQNPPKPSTTHLQWVADMEIHKRVFGPYMGY